jgi:hypothetical protein
MPDVISTAISRLNYDAFARELDVVFTSGRHYRYFEVPAAAYRQLVDAPAKAVFFDERIRNGYRCDEIVARRKHAEPPPLLRSA